jgi:sugar phosphate permease
VESSDRKRWLMLAAVFTATGVLVIDRVNIAIASKFIMHDYGLTLVQMGVVFSSYTVVYSLFNIPGGWFVDRLGPRRVLAASMLLWSLSTLLTAFSANALFRSTLGVLGSLCLMRALVGLFETGGIPSFNSIITSWFAPGDRGRATGTIMAGHALGNATAPLFMAWIIVLFSWQAAFEILGLLGVLVSILWYVVVRDRPVALDPMVADASSDTGVVAGISVPAIPWQRILANRNVQLLLAITFISGYGTYFFYSWLFTYLIEVRHLSIAKSGIVTSLPYFASMVLAPTGGWLSDSLSVKYNPWLGRCALAAAACIVAALGVVLGGTLTDPNVAIAFLVVGAAFTFLFAVVVHVTAMGLAGPRIGLVSGFILASGHVGGSVSPLLSAWIVQETSWLWALCVTALLLMLGAVCWLFIRPDRTLLAAIIQPLEGQRLYGQAAPGV